MARQEALKYVNPDQRRQALERRIDVHCRDLQKRGCEVNEEKVRKQWIPIAEKVDKQQRWQVSEFVFDKPFQLSFTPMVGDEPVYADTFVSARVYSAKPSDSERLDHTNALATAVQYSTTTWIAEGDYEKKIPLSAITDPDPSSRVDYKVYYVVVSFKYASAEATVATELPIVLWQPNGISTRISVAPKDIYALEHKIELLKEMSWVFPKIDKAKRRVIRRLQGLGYKRKRLREEDLNDAVLYLAVSYCCRDLAGDGNPFWFQKADNYLKEFEEILSQESLGYDANNDGVVEPSELSSVGAVYVMR